MYIFSFVLRVSLLLPRCPSELCTIKNLFIITKEKFWGNIFFFVKLQMSSNNFKNTSQLREENLDRYGIWKFEPGVFLSVKLVTAPVFYFSRKSNSQRYEFLKR